MDIPAYRSLCIGLLGAACAAVPAQAVELYYDFESGRLTPWLSAISGGSGVIEVIEHNASLMAHTAQSTGGSRSLSLDFDFVATDRMSFDMQAYSQGYRSGGGVSISFNNAFNVSLGSVQYYNLTDTSTLGTYGHSVDVQQHSYGETLRSWATQAGLAANVPIAKVSVTFTSWNSGFSSAYGEVWFDNFRVTAVPEPTRPALLLTGLALLGVAGRARRWKTT